MFSGRQSCGFQFPNEREQYWEETEMKGGERREEKRREEKTKQDKTGQVKTRQEARRENKTRQDRTWHEKIIMILLLSGFCKVYDKI